MSVPAIKNIDVYQGDDWTLTLKIRSRAADGTLGPYINLTGYVGKAQVRKSTDQASVDAEMSVLVAPNQATSPGEVVLSLTAAQTSPLAGSYLWDFQLTDPAGKVMTYLAGGFICDRQVTR